MAAKFDSQTLINMTVEGANATKVEPMPMGEGYVGQVVKIDIKDGVDKDQKAYTRLELQVEVDGAQDPRILAIGLDKKRIRIDALLDINDQGALDMGPNKNVGLGRLREACGLNDGKFNLGMFQGQMVKFDVDHQPSKDDPEIVYERVKKTRSPHSAE